MVQGTALLIVLVLVLVLLIMSILE